MDTRKARCARKGRSRGYRLLPTVFFAAAILSSCNKQAGTGQEIAKVGDTPLTLEMIKKSIDTTRGLSEMQVRSFASHWVTSELLYQEAKQMGLDNSEEVVQKVEDARREMAIAALLERQVFTDAPSTLTKEDVQRYYAAHAKEWTLPKALVRISSAVFADNDAAKEFRAGAIEGQGWNETIKQFQNSAKFVTKTDSLFYSISELFPEELWKVARSLGTDEVSFPVKTSAGYFVLVLLGKYDEGSTAPLAFVEDEIRDRLLIERRRARYADFVESLRRKYAVQINLTGVAEGKDTLAAAAE